MYLTELDELVGDDYEVHVKLSEIFDGQRVLFQRRGNRLVVLSKKPIAESNDILSILKTIKTGSEFLFVIRMNPVVTRFIDGKNHRVALEQPNIKSWIDQIFSKHGFTADFAFKIEGIRRSRKENHTISLSSVLVNGILIVSDPVQFRKSLESGIGHGKGLGFGFLNIFDFA